MTQVKIDARGLACPLPLLRTAAALRARPRSVTVLVTDGAARDEVTAALEDHGFVVTVRESAEGWRIEAARP